MEDGGIDTVNSAIGEVIADTKTFLENHPKHGDPFNISVSGIYDFAVEIPDPENINTYKWKGINVTHGDTKISETFKELDKKLLANESIGTCKRVPSLAIILIACNKFDEDWEVCLNKLFCNKQFGKSVRKAIVFGAEMNDLCPTKDSLLKFTSYKVYDDLTDEPITNEDGTYKHTDIDDAVVYRNDVERFRRAIVKESKKAINLILGINTTCMEGL